MSPISSTAPTTPYGSGGNTIGWRSPTQTSSIPIENPVLQQRDCASSPGGGNSGTATASDIIDPTRSPRARARAHVSLPTLATSARLMATDPARITTPERTAEDVDQ